MKYAPTILPFIAAFIAFQGAMREILHMTAMDPNSISRASAGCLIGILFAALGGYFFRKANRLP